VTQAPYPAGDDVALADAYAARGTAMHLMLRLGFNPRDEADAERLVREMAARCERPRSPYRRAGRTS
jgi:N-acetylglutamate synthase-like GNAT family acetyltransferase